MIAQTIQLAVTPVFVLVAIGSLMNLLSTRLSRIVDRSRTLQAEYITTEGEAHDVVVREMRYVDRRIDLIGRAILLMVICALAIGVTVVVLFMEELFQRDLQAFAAASFTVAIGLLMASLWLFLLETRTARAALRVPRDYLELHREV